MNTYVVVGETGEYSDNQWWLVRAFDDRNKADAFCNTLVQWVAEHKVNEEFAGKGIPWTSRRELKCPYDPQFKLNTSTGTKYYVTEVLKDDVEVLAEPSI